MAKKTNSLLLRYGINIFWSSSISNPNLEYRIVVFFNLLTFMFKYFNFQILKIQNNLKQLYIYIFPYKERFNFLIRYILYFEKSLLTKYFFRVVYGIKIRKQTKSLFKINKKKEKRVAIFFFTLGFLVFKILILKWLLFLKKFKILIIKKIYLLSFNFYFSDTLTLQGFVVKKKFNLILYFYKLNLLNSFLKFKFLELHCSLLSFLYTGKKLIFTIKSIFDRSFLFFRIPFFFKYLKKKFLKQKLYIINLSFLFLKGNILLYYIHNIIKKTKNKKHIKNLLTFFKELKIIFKMQYIPIWGLKFRIAGRLGGKLRKGTFFYKLGNLKLLTFNTLLDYTLTIVHTFYGVFSLKLWLCVLSENFTLQLN